MMVMLVHLPWQTPDRWGGRAVSGQVGWAAGGQEAEGAGQEAGQGAQVAGGGQGAQVHGLLDEGLLLLLILPCIDLFLLNFYTFSLLVVPAILQFTQMTHLQGRKYAAARNAHKSEMYFAFPTSPSFPFNLCPLPSTISRHLLTFLGRLYTGGKEQELVCFKY